MSETKRILYSFPLSGHSHRAELALSLMGLEFENRVVDLGTGEHKSDWFLELNPEGKVPVLLDGEDVIYESTAILAYLAAKYDADNKWIPASAAGKALVERFFAQASGPLASGPARARLIQLFGANFDEEESITNAHAYLAGLEANLDGRDFLVGDAITFADVALYSYVARAPEGFVSLEPYPNIRGWLARIEAQEGFVEIPHTEVSAAA
ncbi:glutathione S-transferase family protein [Kordiimonas lipolytica]|uniref:Glutathione S-transferase family protein n=1 Tax=Kordiimonas lipolytica TaxID=1662421 RepID=A0ABV8U7R8_9PROT|nr:glutathione S-transferase N-terminal domain-containing protein [Kordiimonas lipolytica]